MTAARIIQGLAPADELARACGMEVKSEMQHRTKVNSYAGSPERVNAPGCVTPNIRMCQGGRGSGSGRKWYALTPGELHGSSSGRTFSDKGPMPLEQSDHLVVAMKLVNVSGAKGMTS